MSPAEFLDTNVLVYAFDDRDSAKQEVSLSLLASGRRFVLSTQVLGEFYVTVTRKLPRPLPVDDAAASVADFGKQRVASIDQLMVVAAIETARQHQLSYWDALIIEAAAATDCARVLSEDFSQGQTIRGVEIVNPFAG